MAFESVNVLSLRATLENIKTDLSNSKITNLKTNVNNSTNNWNAQARSKVANALQNISAKEIELKNLADKYLGIYKLINEYKQKENEIETLESEINGLNSKLYKTETVEKKVRTGDRYTTYKESSKVFDYSVQSQIKSKQNSISSLKRRLAQIESSVKNLI